METQLYTRLYTISGRVQGVGYRYFAAMNADSLGVTGYARNQSDGSVEVYAEGNAAQLDALGKHLGKGPGFARVLGITYTEQKAEKRKYRSFSTG